MQLNRVREEPVPRPDARNQRLMDWIEAVRRDPMIAEARTPQGKKKGR
jgi:hypothetical protein